MKCEDVRPLLPDLADGGPRAVGPVQVHVSSCPDCSAELLRYRDLIVDLQALRTRLVDPPAGFVERILSGVPESQRRRLLARVAADERVQHAALSVGGAVVGATAIAILWWRASRRDSLGALSEGVGSAV